MGLLPWLNPVGNQKTKEPVAITMQVSLPGRESVKGRKWSKKQIPAQQARAKPSKRTRRCDLIC